MNEFFNLLFVFVMGILLGGIFYGGLWWTVRKVILIKKSISWFFISFWLRIIIIIAGFYFIAAGHWQRLLSCLFGFIIARVIIIRFTRASYIDKAQLPDEEVSHAP